ncbi:MFS transporter [Pseudonocardia dioxanivorans]|uniref:MFS transporter n=1 Tax=Pseudonocardia dioxanivorans TaxID=240495 RepID=UPI000CD05D51|nr:MFS transporter [Pseudonocardia dioxanivorans]
MRRERASDGAAGPGPDDPAPGPVAARFGTRFLLPMLVGTSLNPINATLMAIAIVPISRSFGVALSTATWLIAGFYLAAVTVQPIAGGLADRASPRTVFAVGLVVVGASSILGALAPSLTVLIVARVLQGVGTAVAYPSALAMLHRHAATITSDGVARALGALAITGQVIGAVAPPLGAALVGLVGWRITLLVNVPIVVTTLVMTLRWLPRSAAVGPAPAASGLRRRLAASDLPGLALLAGSLSLLFVFLLQLGRPRWLLLGACVALLAAFVGWERRTTNPVVDVMIVTRHPALGWTFLRNGASAVVVVGMFVSLPQWLQNGRGFTAPVAGLIMLPMCLIGTLCALWASRRLSYRLPLLVAHVAMLAGVALLLTLDESTPVWELLAVAGALGISVGLTGVANQAAMFTQAPGASAGTAAGIFRMTWYLGSIVATGLIGAMLGSATDVAGLTALSRVFLVIAALLLVADLAVTAVQRRAPAAA